MSYQNVHNCPYYGSMRGCRYANNCTYIHSNPNSVPLCHNYNHCQFGNNCRFRHINFQQQSQYHKQKSNIHSIDNVNILVNKIKSHDNVEDTFNQLKSLISKTSQQFEKSTASSYNQLFNDVLQKESTKLQHVTSLVDSNLFKIVTDHLLFLQTNYKHTKDDVEYINNVKRAVLFIMFLIKSHSPAVPIINTDISHLKIVFNSLVINSTNEYERCMILEMLVTLFKSNLRSLHYSIGRFNRTYLIPLIWKYAQNNNGHNNHLMLCYLYRICSVSQKDVNFTVESLGMINKRMVKFVMNELYTIVSCSPTNITKYYHLLLLLRDIIKSEKMCRYPLNDGPVLSNKAKTAIYDISCGAGENRFSFTEFCRFYKNASLDAPRHVYTDIHEFEYNAQLEMEGISLQSDVNSMSNVVSGDYRYYGIINKILKRMDENDEWNINKPLWTILTELPKPQQIYKDIMNLNQFICLLFHGKEEFTVMYYVLSLNLVCSNQCDNYEWRKRFVEENGLETLVKMFLQCYCWYNVDPDGYEQKQWYQVGTAVLVKIMHYMCKVYLPSDVTLSLFMHHAFNMIRNNKDDILCDEIGKILAMKNNYLIHLVVLDAKKHNNKKVGLLNVIPMQVVRICSDVLICGYIRQCKLSFIVPPDVVNVMIMLFF